MSITWWLSNRWRRHRVSESVAAGSRRRAVSARHFESNQSQQPQPTTTHHVNHLPFKKYTKSTSLLSSSSVFLSLERKARSKSVNRNTDPFFHRTMSSTPTILYRNLLRQARQMNDYNFRSYAMRRAKQGFVKNKALQG